MRVIVAIHGIQSRKKNSWMYAFCDAIGTDPRFKDDAHAYYYYGYFPAIDTLNGLERLNIIREFMKFLRQLRADYPQADLSIVAHSYGTEVSFQAIKRSGEDGKAPILVDKLILVAGIVSAHREINYRDTLRAGKIKELHNYCSYSDEVCRYNPFGHCGCFGFLKSAYDMACYDKPFADLNIFNHQQKTLGHSDYFVGSKFMKEWLDIIAR